MTRRDLASAIEASLDRQGWLEHLEPIDVRDLVSDHIELIAFVTAALPSGTVVGRSGGEFHARREVDAPGEAA